MKSFLYPFVPMAAAGLLCAQTAPPPKPKPSPATKTAPAKPVAPAPKKAVAPSTSIAPPNPAANGSDNGKVILTVGSEKITEKEYETFIEALPDQFKAQARGPQKRQVAEQLVRVKLLAQAARQRGLDKDMATQARINFQPENLLAGALFTNLQSQAKVDDAAVRKHYDEPQSEYQQAQARHILIKFKGSP